MVPSGFSCSTVDLSPSPEVLNREAVAQTTFTSKCVSMYYETDFDLYQANNSSIINTVNWMTAVHNNVATLYYNNEIRVSLRQIFVWASADPYNGNTLEQQLALFKVNRPAFNGDVGQLICIDPSSLGGLAKINGLCSNTDKYAYSDISFDYDSVPAFSFTVNFITHEFGHLLGSQHTHSCSWNGFDLTAIDGCGPTYGANRNPPVTYEGLCFGAPIPPNGGTIMSYCYAGAVGTNFSEGFGPQPAARIRGIINNASCLNNSCISTLTPSCSKPTNDECAGSYNAISLPFATSYQPLPFTTCGATVSGFNSCFGTQEEDVFFSFITSIGATSAVINIVSSSTFDALFQVLTGPCGAGMQQVANGCINNTGNGGTESITLTGLTSNTTYFIRVWGHSSVAGNSNNDFTICVQNCNSSDLIIIEPSLNTASINPGSSIVANFIEKNIGNENSVPNYVNFHLSSDAVLTPGSYGDIYLGQFYVDQTLAPATQRALLSKQLAIPLSVAAGSYYLFMAADASGIITECDDKNNFSTVIISVSE